MYVTRSLSHYKSSPEALYQPPEGPNSGYLIIQDEESETYSCFGLYKNRYLAGLPFPQNKRLTTRYASGNGEHRRVYYNEVVFIPVLNQPLSSNRYYAIKPRGSHKGEAFACSKEEDMTPCCFCNCVSDVKPRPLEPNDVYQQFEIVPYKASCRGDGSFNAKSVAEDGYPPHFLRRKGWEIYTKTPKNYELREANGLNDSLRSRLPEFSFSPSNKTSNSVVVGKWYCPFMFIKEGRLNEQVKMSIFYEMTLEQKWEPVFEQENEHNDKGNDVFVKASFQNEAVFIGESQQEAIWDEKDMVDGTLWFFCRGADNVKEESVGLRREIVERMRWEEEKVGWVDGGDNRIHMVTREEKFEGSGGWKRFGCYVLVERFVLKRMDGTLVMAYDFRHIHQIKTIFE
ncbi:uncharacterized protein LOC111920354 [Lactuca sativa]|uniref:Uncharacterized protein n=1 Tax=Lactuca sativa TaxID=4236 RepID=A0A9R1W429_LACSA|nr:uncharacterized protein LOC111920354 [Lactuca sativa]KAJ0218030.1 hypothetical protein LSAT_V11C300125680 [Lactuca sativa]